MTELLLNMHYLNCFHLSRYGIDSFSKEEIGYNESRINSFGIFKHLEAETRKEIAEKVHRISYLSDKVIESDSSDSQYVYFVTKGSCYVIRVLSIPNQQQREKERTLITRNSNKSFLPNFSHLDSASAVGNTTETYLPSIHASSLQTEENINNNKNRAQHAKIWLQEHTRSTNIRRLNKSRGPKPTDHRKTKRTLKRTDPNINQYCCDMNHGMGAFLKVDELYQGRVFGLNAFLPEEKQDNRKFTLVSSGCEVIRVPRSLMKEYCEHNVHAWKEVMDTADSYYPTDEELREEFNSFNRWRCYREKFVDHVATTTKGLSRKTSNITREGCRLMTRRSSRDSSCGKGTVLPQIK